MRGSRSCCAFLSAKSRVTLATAIGVGYDGGDLISADDDWRNIINPVRYSLRNCSFLQTGEFTHAGVEDSREFLNVWRHPSPPPNIALRWYIVTGALSPSFNNSKTSDGRTARYSTYCDHHPEPHLMMTCISIT